MKYKTATLIGYEYNETTPHFGKNTHLEEDTNTALNLISNALSIKLLHYVTLRSGGHRRRRCHHHQR
jgi:hypothetical protein